LLTYIGQFNTAGEGEFAYYVDLLVVHHAADLAISARLAQGQVNNKLQRAIGGCYDGIRRGQRDLSPYGIRAG
jgi:hypothetical protein